MPELLGQDFLIQGMQKRGIIGKPENLHPLAFTSKVSQLWDLSTRWMGRSHVGKSEEIAPALARRIELRPRKGQEDLSHEATMRQGEFWVFMRDDIFWQPINPSTLSPDIRLNAKFLKPYPVTAHDVKFYLDTIMNPHIQTPSAIAQREFYADVEDFLVIDDYTFVVRWKLKDVVIDEVSQRAMRADSLSYVAGLRPFPRFVYQYAPDGKKIVGNDSDPMTYRKHAVWAEVFLQHWSQQTIISCGDWLLEARSPREFLFRKNPFAADSAGALNRYLHFTIRDTPLALWHAFKINELDTCILAPSLKTEKESFLNSPLYLKQTAQDPKNEIGSLRYEDKAFFFIGWNCQNPLFQDAKLRRALTMAMDRAKIVDQYLGGDAVTINGPFMRSSPSINPSITTIPFDPFLAQKKFEELGWKDVGGILHKDGMPFSFALTYYAKSTTARLIAEGVADQLRDIGIDCRINGLDGLDYESRLSDKQFDAYLGGYSQNNFPENIRQLWHSSSALRKGSSNMVGFANERADSIIDAVDYCFDREKKMELYREFGAILAQEQPFTFLYTPITHLLYRKRLENVFIPKDHQELIPGAILGQPQSRLFYVHTTP
mgnify:CR=1 FL=1